MRILILGGTVFLGRAVVDAGLARWHELTLFNRGQSNPGLFPGIEQFMAIAEWILRCCGGDTGMLL